MKSFFQFIDEAEDRTAQQTALSAHQARTAGMRKATSGTAEKAKRKPFKKIPSTGISDAIKNLAKKKLEKPASKPTQTIEPKIKPNPTTKGLGARPA